jgi:hypothetical protein
MASFPGESPTGRAKGQPAHNVCMGRRINPGDTIIDAAMAAGCCLLFVVIISAKPFQHRLSADYEARQASWQAFRGEHCNLSETMEKWPGGLPVPRQIADPMVVSHWQCDGKQTFISVDSRVPVDWSDGATVAQR